MRWWYREPAAKFWEGLPIGTGRFAAMLYGRTEQEVIPFNDETLWAGSPYNPVNPNGLSSLPDIRAAIFAGKYEEAQQMCDDNLFSYPHKQVHNYQAMGRLHLYFDGHEEVEDYRRELDLNTATVTITYRIGTTTYERQVFASYPDQVIVHRITASDPARLSLKVRLDSIQPTAASRPVSSNELVMQGGALNTGEIHNGVQWTAQVRVNAKGGLVRSGRIDEGNGSTRSCIEVHDADEVVVVLSGATNYVSWNDISADSLTRCREYMKAAQEDYGTLRKRHLEDYQSRFRRCELFVGANQAAVEDTTTRLSNMRQKGTNDPHFINQYFQYARYLLLAASREGTLAFNNHNIWLDDLEGRWQGRWTLNINLQECFWPVETTNLSEIADSMYLFVTMLSESGKRTAAELYGCRGWCAHHGTDLWMNTTPTDGATWGMTPTMGAWLCHSLWEHYQFRPDRAYLTKIYPLLKGSALFCLDFLVVDPESGYLVTCPSASPENSFRAPDGQNAAVSLGCAMDISLIRNNFKMVTTASRAGGRRIDPRSNSNERRNGCRRSG
jgi:alpha-L-fucosidase 2